jgi:hypothetical protein
LGHLKKVKLPGIPLYGFLPWIIYFCFSPILVSTSFQLATERWSPQQNVRTVLLSVISLLNDPNTESPANVDAAISYRNYKGMSRVSITSLLLIQCLPFTTENTDQKYARIVRRQVEKSKADAHRDGVVVPETVDEYLGQEKREGERVALIRLRGRPPGFRIYCVFRGFPLFSRHLRRQ